MSVLPSRNIAIFSKYIRLINDPGDASWYLRAIRLDDEPFSYKITCADPIWRTQGEWKDLRVAIVLQDLQRTLLGAHDDLDVYM